MHFIGIDIGSTAVKVTVLDSTEKVINFTMPTGWSSIETANTIKEMLKEKGIETDKSRVIATGYGRVSVPYADKTVTEITCHGRGVHYLLGRDTTIIDIGGQDTKIISLQNGRVTNFTMNDKCAAGTGRFLEVMGNTLGVTIYELATMALSGEDISITSMCTVFAESEVISLIGKGTPRKDIARGIINSITGRVYSMLHKHGISDTIYLSGGLCETEPFIRLLADKLERDIITNPLARYAGSLGAALIAKG